MRSGRIPRSSVLRAFDEVEFGSKNTFNLRESLPSAADARFRTEAWLRERQISRANEWKEHSPGSFVVKLASISSLLEAPRRKRDRTPISPTLNPESLKDLDHSTLELLRRLAIRTLESLGMREPDKFVEAEMLSKFHSLAGGINPGEQGEARLREAIKAALDQLDE